ncbi:hypothetical protein [Brachybacterium sp. Marseille-Q7125]|uniref:hypothetical protein n=1 Tax=Brachybacterium sp. Marseille-Q7125 TaxID=2932815 RepID=UPI001FF4F676|nr:hypothetical protein [Brachybacterium sp. Marseille-Q7125]
MSGFYGGVPEQMRAQGVACRQGSQTIIQTTDAVTALIDSVPWLGPDAIAFRALWHGQVKPSLYAKAEDIRAKGEEITQHAEEQDHVSNSDGGGGGIFDAVRDFIEDLFQPGGPFGPGLPGGPFSPMNPAIIDFLKDSLMDGGQRPGQEMYGGSGYHGRGQAAGNDRPLGAYNDDFSFGDGRELEGDLGYADVYARGGASFGGNHTVDKYGNHTGTIGGRAGAEVGFEGSLNGPNGSVTGSANAGAEAYAEAGGTVGPDGFSAGGKAGIGAYANGSITSETIGGGSQSVDGQAYAGAYASANAYSHATRNADGNINGWTLGADARAFAGAEAGATFGESSPGGWFSGSTEIKAKAGAGGGAGGGAVISTDAIGFNVSGELAAGLGLKGSTSFAIHPNAIVDTFTPGDYNLDDAISDGGAFVNDLKDSTSKYSPFW